MAVLECLIMARSDSLAGQERAFVFWPNLTMGSCSDEGGLSISSIRSFPLFVIHAGSDDKDFMVPLHNFYFFRVRRLGSG
jgi:hypothetical protein